MPQEKRKKTDADDVEDEEQDKNSEELKLKKDSGGNYWAELSDPKEKRGGKTQKRITVNKFKVPWSRYHIQAKLAVQGNVNIHLREYYEKDGDFLPGKAGKRAYESHENRG
eukprot:767878-Hanusia_phi.AAC.8